MFNPGYASSIFKCIRQETGLNALRLARSLEKSTYKLEAHHRHLNFTHQALEHHWFPKSLRFSPPGSHPVFKRIMKRTSIHCMRARISICHEQIRSTNRIINENRRKLAVLISEDSFSRFALFLKNRAKSVQDNISTRHEKKLQNLRSESTPTTDTDPSKWVVNLSTKPLSTHERAILNEGPKFAPTPHEIPTKEIVAEVEAAIANFPDDSKDAIRTSAENLLRRTQPPKHKNTTSSERKAFHDLKKDKTRVVMKADKGNCFVVMDRTDYDKKMEELLSDRNTYEEVAKPPFKRIERELNLQLLALKQHNKLDHHTYSKLHSTDGIPPAIRGSVKHHKENNPLRPIVTCRETTLYNTSKHLAEILSPLQNHNGYSVTNSAEFVCKIANTTIDDDEIMVSFDVVSLFTAIPVDKTCEHIRNKLLKDKTLQQRTQLSIDDIIALLPGAKLAPFGWGVNGTLPCRLVK